MVTGPPQTEGRDAAAHDVDRAGWRLGRLLVQIVDISGGIIGGVIVSQMLFCGIRIDGGKTHGLRQPGARSLLRLGRRNRAACLLEVAQEARYEFGLLPRIEAAQADGIAAFLRNRCELVAPAAVQEIAVRAPVIAHVNLQVRRDMVEEAVFRIEPLAAELAEGQHREKDQRPVEFIVGHGLITP